MKKTLVIIPTYNELENIRRLIPDLLGLYPEINLLIVDDNSPDGTGEFVRNFSVNDRRVRILERSKKSGLGTAYVAGFEYMLREGYELAIQMDADYSHDPEVIGKFLTESETSDLIIGSRYKCGVNVINWPMKRLLLSYFANKYTKFVTGLPVDDSTGGFKCIRREVLDAIDLKKIKSNGYSFQMEITFKAWKKGFRIKEIPIVFTDRVEGTSKMSRNIVREAVFMVWKLRILSILGLLK